ncbi:ATP-dependent DNA helicase PIF1-like protein [Tanacetum coccineum]
MEHMPYPNAEYTMEGYKRLVNDELNYNRPELSELHHKLYRSLTDEQKCMYANILDVVENDKGGMFFVYSYGGTGKTYLYKTMTATLRSEGKIVLNVASSGIAALLLDRGRTAHSRFAIPINIFEDSMCSISADAFDRTMRDICRTENNKPSDQVFGGKVVVLGGDFRQILLVIQNGSRQDVVHVSLNSSELWQHCIVMKLTVNMRLKARKNSNEIRETKEFVDWILNIGNGKIGEKNDGESTIEFSEEMLIPDSENHVTIIQETYPDLIHNLWNPSFFPGKSNISANARNGLSTKVC